MNKMDKALPLLLASQQLIGLARDLETDEESFAVYQLIDSIDAQLFIVYEVPFQGMGDYEFDRLLERTVVAYRLNEITISECLEQLNEFAGQHMGGR